MGRDVTKSVGQPHFYFYSHVELGVECFHTFTFTHMSFFISLRSKQSFVNCLLFIYLYLTKHLNIDDGARSDKIGRAFNRVLNASILLLLLT